MELYKTVKTTAPFISSEEWCVQKISQQIREDELGFSAVECFYCWSRLRYPWKEGDVGGYPIPQYRKKDWQIPKYCVKNRPNTDTTVTIGHVYLKLYPSRVFVYLHHVCTRTTTDIARKREKTLGAIHSTKISAKFGLKLNGRDSFNQNSNRSDREKWSTSKDRPVFSKLFRLDRTGPLSFGPKFREILVEWIAPNGSVRPTRKVSKKLACVAGFFSFSGQAIARKMLS